MAYLLALDQGTTSSRAIAFDAHGAVLGVAQQPFTQHFPQPGWVEHDAEEIWQSQLAVAREVIDRLGQPPAAIGITNQRETALVWDRATGTPLAPAIVWQDRRTVARCLELARSPQARVIETKTGLVIDAYFSATKWQWLLETQPGLRARAKAGELALGTVDSWLVWKLTGGACHITDASNASRTMLYNLETGQWDPELLSVFGIPGDALPRIVDSSGVIGETTPGLLHAQALPIAGTAGDQQAATFGQACHRPGDAKLTYGTGCFLLACAGNHVVHSQHRLLATVGWQREGRRSYCLEGGVFMGGATVQWLRDGLGIIDSAEAIEPLARSVADTGDVWLVPAFAGLGAPHWDGQARGLLIGLTRGTTRAHIARAALQSIALQSAELVHTMNRDLPTPIGSLRVDGGACRNDLLMQMQADLTNVVIERPANTETTALGAAMLAGLAIGMYRSPESLAERWRAQSRFEPRLSDRERESVLARWQEATARSWGWAR